jgi:hypothetical protein
MGEVIAELLGGVLRFSYSLIFDVVVELLIRGAGYWICRLLRRDVDPEGALVVWVGIAFWIALIVGSWVAFSWLSAYLDVDQCLDKGGAWDHVRAICVMAK